MPKAKSESKTSSSLKLKSKPQPKAIKTKHKKTPLTSNKISKIKDLALKTQKTVHDQLINQTESLRSKLSAYGIGVDDVKAKAKQLEQVLKDIRDRDFLKQPAVQNLVERVTYKRVEKSNVEAQKMAETLPRKKKLTKKQKEKQEKQFLALSEMKAKALNAHVVQSIFKKVEEVRKTISDTAGSALSKQIRRKK